MIFWKLARCSARSGGVAVALIGAGDAKFGGGVERESFEGLLEGGDGFVVVLKLGLQVADEIAGVGFGRELRDVGEGGDPLFDVAEIFVDEAEVVPGVGIVGKFFGGCSRAVRAGSSFCWLRREMPRLRRAIANFGSAAKGLLEIFLRVGELLLVHVGDAEGVEAERVGGVGRRGYGCGDGHRRRWSGIGAAGASRAGAEDGCAGDKEQRGCESVRSWSWMRKNSWHQEFFPALLIEIVVSMVFLPRGDG